MKSKQSEYAITGLIIGIVVGILIGLSALNMVKKSQRGQLIWFSVGISAFGFGAIGYSKGSSQGKNIDIEVRLGINSYTDDLVQQGRVWLAFTEWTNHIDNIDYKLITTQNPDKILITELNGTIVMNHEIKSGSKDNVTKHHLSARNYIFNQQKEAYK